MFSAQDGHGGGKGAGFFFTESPRARGELEPALRKHQVLGKKAWLAAHVSFLVLFPAHSLGCAELCAVQV